MDAYVYDIAAKGRVAVTPFLDLVFVKNIGISYSLFNQESQTGQYLLAGFAVAGQPRAVGLDRAIRPPG